MFGMVESVLEKRSVSVSVCVKLVAFFWYQIAKVAFLKSLDQLNYCFIVVQD